MTIIIRLFPQVDLLDHKTAMKLAIEHLEVNRIETSWSDSLASCQGDQKSMMLINQEWMIIENRQKIAEASPQAVYRAFCSLGGERGWLYMDWIGVYEACSIV